MIRKLRLARTLLHADGGGTAAPAPALLAALLAALLIAPGGARAADECGGSITSSNLVRECTAAHGGGTGTFATGIIYHGNGVNPGATGVATLNVPGGAAAWTITSGDATGFPGSGIALDSRDGDIAGGGLALTVGGTGNANNVNIRQHSTRVNDGSNNNNGIVVNNQFTGASTTTVTVHDGVTIGTSSARMGRNGIRARVWLGSGKATFTNHGDIHSTFEGIDVTRGDSADTTAATTITNTGAISAGTRGIYLRYLAGDTTGGGGNTASTTAGAAKITNRGTITKHTGTGSQGAIELDYDRGHGNAEVDNRGTITATASGVTNGYGILLRYRNRAGTASGTATIGNTHTIASKQHAIFLENAGGGASTITNSGALTAENAGNSGIHALHTGSAGAVTVENSGAITSTATGIEVWSRNKNAAGTNAGVSITHSAGVIAVSAGGGIKAALGDSDDTAANNAGNVVIKVTGGSVRSSGTILEGVNRQSGDVTIEASEGVTLTSTGQHGVFADMPEGNAAGRVTITNHAAITGPKTGIYVRRSAAATGDGAPISITNTGHIKKTGEANWQAILVADRNAGDVTVTSRGDIGEARAMHKDGIFVEKQEGASGGVTVTSSGDVVTAGRGIYAAVNRGLAKLDVTGGSFNVDGTIVEAKNLQRGDVEIDVAEGVTLVSSEQHGVFAELGANNAAGRVTINQAGSITTPKTGIFVRHCPDDTEVRCAGEGAIEVTNTGPIRKAAGATEDWMGIFVEEKGSGPVTVTNRGDIGTTNARHDHGILVQGKHTGDTGGLIKVTNSGALTARLYGIWTPVREADRRIEIAQSGAITGRKGIFAQIGRLSAEGETRAAADQPVIDVEWTGGDFSHGEDAVDSDAPRFRANTAAAAVFQDPEVEVERIVRGRDHGSAVGIEAQVMTWLHVAREVARGDDQDIDDKAAQDALLDLEHADAAVRERTVAIVKQFRDALENDDLIVPDSVFNAIKDGATSLDGVTDAEIVAHLVEDDENRRILLRNVLKHGLSNAEKAVLEAVLTDDVDGLAAALDDEAAGFSDAYKAEVRGLLDNHNVGNIRVNMTGGSIVSRGDGIRAYFGTHHDDNGAIEVTVGEGVSVTGGEAGVWVANAGLGLRIEKRYAPADVRAANADAGEDDLVTVADHLKQVVRVDGTVTGGTDAAVHLSGGGALIVSATGKVYAGDGDDSSGRAVLVNDPGPAIIWIAGEVRGAAGAPGAVHLTGGGSVTVGMTGSVKANGADLGIQVDNEPTRVVVLQASRFATEDGLPTKEGVREALARLGTVGGSGIPDADDDYVPDGRAQVRVVATYPDGEPSGPYVPAKPGDDGVLEPDPGVLGGLPDCGDMRELRNGECMKVGEEPPPPPPPPPLDSTPVPLDCVGLTDGRCRLYEALPSVLLAMNGLPTYGERTSAARDARGGWAQVEASGGKWKAAASTRPDVAYDYRRHGLRAGMDFAAGETGRLGVSFHGLEGSAEMSGQAGKLEVDLSGFGVGVHGTMASAGGVYLDAQAAVTWYEADLKSDLMKNDVDGRGYALGVEVGMRLPVMDDVLTAVPRMGLEWSNASLDDFRDMRAPVSVEQARSLKGRVGVGAEKVLDGAGMDRTRLFGSLDVEQEFKEETEARVYGSPPLKASARKTRIRAAVGGARAWGEGRYALQGSLGYSTGGGGNRELGAGLDFAVRF